ncbi:hypothetical protein QAD02_017810 [Eretmocerus hayati]|uniref:Uncharacterized protein n=1 Tax=Eretmocerus hayati TaxID=131215 RepID=A0ACC2PG47_9HYME|nr:hypothetical protein QAD02_017810 [Eretmocerus hayati]
MRASVVVFLLTIGIISGQYDSSDEEDEECDIPPRVFCRRWQEEHSSNCEESQPGPSYEYSEPQNYVPQGSGTNRNPQHSCGASVTDQTSKPAYEQTEWCNYVRTQIQGVMPTFVRSFQSMMSGSGQTCNIDPTFVDNLMNIAFDENSQLRDCTIESQLQQAFPLLLEQFGISSPNAAGDTPNSSSQLSNPMSVSESQTQHMSPMDQEQLGVTQPSAGSDAPNHDPLKSYVLAAFFGQPDRSRDCDIDRAMRVTFAIAYGDLEIINTGPNPVSEYDPAVARVILEALITQITSIVQGGSGITMGLVSALINLDLRQSQDCDWADRYKIVYNHADSSVSLIDQSMGDYTSGLRENLLSNPLNVVRDLLSNKVLCNEGPDIPFPEEAAPYVAKFKSGGKKSSTRGQSYIRVKDATEPVYTYKHHASPDALIKRFLEKVLQSFVQDSERGLPEARRKTTLRFLRLLRWVLICSAHQARDILGSNFVYSPSQIAEDSTELQDLISGLASFPPGDFFFGPSQESRGPYDPNFFDLEDYAFDHEIRYFIGREHYEVLCEFHQRLLQFISRNEEYDGINIFELFTLVVRYHTAIMRSDRPVIPITLHSDYVDITFGEYPSERKRFDTMIDQSGASNAKKAAARKKLASIPDTKKFKIPIRQKEELDGIKDEGVTTQMPRRFKRAVGVHVKKGETCTGESAFADRQLNRLFQWLKEKQFLQVNLSSSNDQYPNPWGCALKKLKAAYYVKYHNILSYKPKKSNIVLPYFPTLANFIKSLIPRHVWMQCLKNAGTQLAPPQSRKKPWCSAFKRIISNPVLHPDEDFNLCLARDHKNIPISFHNDITTFLREVATNHLHNVVEFQNNVNCSSIFEATIPKAQLVRSPE